MHRIVIYCCVMFIVRCGYGVTWCGVVWCVVVWCDVVWCSVV